MWLIGVLAAATSIAVAMNMLGLIGAEAGAQERPEREELGLGVLVVWALGVAAWGALVADAIAKEREGAALALSTAAMLALIGPVGARAVVASLRTLLGTARQLEADRVYSATGFAAHEVQNLADRLGDRFAPIVERLEASLRALKAQAEERRKAKTQESLVAVARRRREDTAPAYENWADEVRIWHTAGIEWLALLATLVLRAGIVASAAAVPTSLSTGVAPEPGWQAVPWMALVVWCVGLALLGPLVASVAMDRDSRVMKFALAVEGGLLLLALAFTPSWAVGASLAGVWNCANRLPEGFSWKARVPQAGAATGLTLLMSVLAHGGGFAGALLEVAVAGAIAVVISNSYAIFWPATLFALTVVRFAKWRSGRAARRTLAAPMTEVEAALYALAAAAPEDAHVRTSVALMEAWLRGSTPRIEPTVGATIDALVRERLGSRAEITYLGARGPAALRDLRWNATRDRRTQLFGLLILQVAAEVERHGKDELVVELERDQDSMLIRARNPRRMYDAPHPRGGTASVLALAAAIHPDNTDRPGPDPEDPVMWSVRFRVPLSMAT